MIRIAFSGRPRRLITKALFPYVQNHGEMAYRAIESSFVPTSPE